MTIDVLRSLTLHITPADCEGLQQLRPFTEDEPMHPMMMYGVRSLSGDLGPLQGVGKCTTCDAPAYYQYVNIMRDFNTAFNETTYELYIYTYKNNDGVCPNTLDKEHVPPVHVARVTLSSDGESQNLRSCIYNLFNSGTYNAHALAGSYLVSEPYDIYKFLADMTDALSSASSPLTTRIVLNDFIWHRLDNTIRAIVADSYGHLTTAFKVLRVVSIY